MLSDWFNEDNTVDAVATNKRINELEAQIKEHNRRYYDQDAPTITDPEYDALKKELEQLNPESPVLDDIGESTFGEKYEHTHLMGSLAKCHSAQEVMQRFSGLEVVLMPKIDGCSMATHFRGGNLILAATRGDGKVGEKITPNAAEISNLPSHINSEIPLEFRGEAYIAKSDFYGIMDQPGYRGKPNGLANPRNAAAGGLRQKDPGVTRASKIRFVAYELLSDAGKMAHDTKLEALKHLGFEIPPYKTITCVDEETVQKAIDELKAMDASLPYETDGVVIRINDASLFDNAGLSGKCPKGALAFKFETVKAKSTVLDIEWTTSRTGRICPVAIITPTRISGSIVQRITLNNPDWIAKADVAIGDDILFEKANEIIPCLVSVLKRNDPNRNINYPVHCPSCGQLTDNCYCINPLCPAQFNASVIHIIEKLEIMGIGPGIVDKIVEAGLIKQPFEIFDVTEASLMSKGFGDRQAEIICQALKNVEASKAHILACLGIEGWGRRMFETVAKNVSLDDIIAGTVPAHTLAATPGIGYTRACALIDGIKDNKTLLDGLLTRVAIKKEMPRGTQLAGLSFCITGTLSKGRGQVQMDIAKAGGDVKNTVSAKLKYLVAGDEAGSKLDKAKALGVKIINEQELYDMIGEDTDSDE